MSRRRRLAAELLLASVTVFWGATFPVVKDAVARTPVLSFLGVRFLLSAVLLALFAGRRLASLDRRALARGVGLGTLLFLSYLFQTLGLARTSAANAGFLTGLNVVWVPLLSGPLLGKPPPRAARIGVVFALAGLLLLTWHTPWRLEPGDALVVLCSGFVALHILGLDVLTHRRQQAEPFVADGIEVDVVATEGVDPNLVSLVPELLDRRGGKPLQDCNVVR